MKPKFFRSPAGFRAWISEHHASTPELLVGCNKKGSGRPSMMWPESVDEALCFGTPRRQRSETLPEPFGSKLQANKAAWAFFQAQPPSYRKTIGWWVVSAKQEAPRLKRLNQLIEDSSLGRRL
jgi:uncharacterized protein YdeI (YjbR/CyaY-like superfamily)